MPTYAELAAEPWWDAEFEAPALAAFNQRLRTFYGHTKAQTGSKGDNRHLKGRHRSRNWDLNSKYCTNRAYATTDSRDKAGDGDWLRATDVGISGATLRAACARLDAAVKAGKLPIIAEWFGSINGTTVTGWFEGHQSSSDSSHLYHLHLGYWNDACNDQDQFTTLNNIILGRDALMALSDNDQERLAWRVSALLKNQPEVTGGPSKGEPNELHNALATLDKRLTALTGSPTGQISLEDLTTACRVAINTTALHSQSGSVDLDPTTGETSPSAAGG